MGLILDKFSAVNHSCYKFTRATVMPCPEDNEGIQRLDINTIQIYWQHSANFCFPSYFFQRESFRSYKTKTISLKSVQECPKEKKHASAMFPEISTWRFIQHDLSIKANQQMFGGEIPTLEQCLWDVSNLVNKML